MPVARRAAPELPADLKLVEAWRRLLDPRRTSVKRFVEFLRVPTKRVSLLGGAALVDFREYASQAGNREAIEAQWRAGEGGKQIDAKPRQEGHTTGYLTLFWERFMRGGGGTWNVFSYDDDAVEEIFRLVTSFRVQTPPWVFTHLLRETNEGDGVYTPGGGFWKRSSSRQLHLGFPDGVDIMLQCFTAGDLQSGSGSAPRGVLFDEFSKWKPHVKRDPTAMSEGWLDAPGNIFAIPSTGQGNEEFAGIFREAWDAPEHKSAAGYIARFTPWLGHVDRRHPFESEKDKEIFVKTIGQLREYGTKEEQRLVDAGATPEELHWRRRKIAGPAIKWDLALFSREFPMTPEDMFVSSSASVLQVDLLKTHAARAAARDAGAVVGDFVWRDGQVQFFPVPNGMWTLLEAAADGGRYCFGNDPASGKLKLTASNKEPDFSLAYFDELFTGRTCARLRQHISGRPLAEELFKACVYFNGARGYIERNQHGEHVIATFEELVHGRFRGEELLLLQYHPVHGDGKRPDPTSGWHTSKKSKERLIAELREFIAETGEWTPESRETPYCPLFIGESLRYERNESGNASASKGHDDTIVAKGLSVCARNEILNEKEISSRLHAKDGDELKHWKQQWRADEEREREREDVRERDAMRRDSPLRQLGY
jgi:hypothetical protein